MTINDDKGKEFRAKIKYVESMIREIENQIGRKILGVSSVFGDNGQYYASFTATTSFLGYDIPYEIFMELPPKDLVIEIMRAISIEFNDYENQ